MQPNAIKEICGIFMLLTAVFLSEVASKDRFRLTLQGFHYYRSDNRRLLVYGLDINISRS